MNRLMKYFDYSHLPGKLQAVSLLFFELATHIDTTIPESAEKTVGLRKLLEAKDCIVRAALDTGSELNGDVYFRPECLYKYCPEYRPGSNPCGPKCLHPQENQS